ncbi:hypothetical protein [Hydrogenophaga laconesensis]|uniref:Uncharacterized protein n=1 Tax=Hydrogenophaga laconesensis TaxID=1805971 RepID=A0ABU1V487_9BURK|nr:hypothetical protein [Hydrogenophaga laconesensis]MDR7092279.1 hypothetical protein [Hydrogenophaga laconesensis]
MTTWIFAVLAVAASIALVRRLIQRKGLVGDWRKSIRWYSNWCFATIASIQGSVLVFVTQEQLQAKILFYPSWTWGALVQAAIAILAVAGFVLRNISQEKKDIPEHRDGQP